MEGTGEGPPRSGRLPDAPAALSHAELVEWLEDLDQAVENTGMLIERRLRPPWRSRLLRIRLGNLGQQYIPRPVTVPDRYRRPASLATWPVVSVVTPVFNAAAFVEPTISSVLGQEYPRLEYIVQDGGSTDGTLEILKRHATRITRVESVRDRGQADALNRGFRHATGEVLAYLNGDDLLLPGAVHYVAAFLARHPHVDVVYSHRVLIDEEGWEIGRWVLPPHEDGVLSWADYVPQETLFWRRRIWEKVGACFDESFQFAMDWDLLLRFRDAGARFARLPRFLGAFRIHRWQKTSARMWRVGRQEMARLRARVHGRPVAPVEVMRRVRRYLLRHALWQRLYQLGVLRY